jgi:hypothetical protein
LAFSGDGKYTVIVGTDTLATISVLKTGENDSFSGLSHTKPVGLGSERRGITFWEKSKKGDRRHTIVQSLAIFIILNLDFDDGVKYLGL